jgi:CubicO group peptidase (beta-lactamase class C family)
MMHVIGRRALAAAAAAAMAMAGTLAPSAPAAAQQDATRAAAEAAERMRRVETGLLQAVVVTGAPSGMSLDERMRHYRVPGVSIAVINDGRIEWAKGYGVLEAGGTVKVDTATLFQAASISKPVAAVAALRLVAQGRLALDADVNDALTSWRVEENAHTTSSKVTLRRLLSHNAGLTVHGFRGYAEGEAVPTLVQLLDGAAPANSPRVLPDTTPGAIWRYSGGGSSVAQLLMEDVTGTPFPELVRELVLAPAGMPHSTYEQPLPPPRHASAAVGHRMSGEPVAGRWHTYPELFAAGLWTTPSDLARLAIEVQRAYAGASDRVLSPAMARQMLEVQAGGYGLGFAVSRGDGWISFSHGGSNQGYRAILYAFADRGQGAVVMTSGDMGAELMSEVIRAIADVYDWPAQRAVARTIVPVNAARLAALEGTWRGEGPGGRSVNLAVRSDGTSLHVTGFPLGETTMHHFGDDAFFMVGGHSTLRFERAADGSATSRCCSTAVRRCGCSAEGRRQSWWRRPPPPGHSRSVNRTMTAAVGGRRQQRPARWSAGEQSNADVAHSPTRAARALSTAARSRSTWRTLGGCTLTTATPRRSSSSLTMRPSAR